LKQTVDDYIQTKDAGWTFVLYYIDGNRSFMWKSFRSFLSFLGKLADKILLFIEIKLFKHLELQDEIF
jgi:hypothetical protein